jgi:hypothetical protein
MHKEMYYLILCAAALKICIFQVVQISSNFFYSKLSLFFVLNIFSKKRKNILLNQSGNSLQHVIYRIAKTFPMYEKTKSSTIALKIGEIEERFIRTYSWYAL